MKRRAALKSSKQPTKRARLSPANELATSQLIQREIRKQGDLKYADSQGSVDMTATGEVLSLFVNMTRGTLGYNNFVGNTLNIRGITVKYYCRTNQIYNACRVLIFQWMDPSIPAVNGVLQNISSGIGPISNILATNRENIRVLYDKHFVMAPTAATDTTTLGYGTFSDSVYIPGSRCQKVKANTNSTTAQHGNICMLLISDDNVLSFPVINYYTRVTFYD